jgi:DNA-binding MarR family transcriptional regulator
MGDYEKIMDIIREDVKYEDELVELIIHVCLSAWSREPLNLFLKGPSAVGKSWIAKNVVKFFPQSNVWNLGGMSPKSLIHLPMTPIDEEGNPIQEPVRPLPRELKDPEKRAKYQEELREYHEKLRNARWLIDLRHKILLFLEKPERDTFDILRPILSHDAFEICFPFVDRKGKGPLRTMNVVLRGWPATIFCSEDVPWTENLASRSLTASPKESKEKIKASFEVSIRPYADPFFILDSQKTLSEGREIVKKFIGMEEIKALIPYEDALKESFPASSRRHMRDFKKFISLIEIHTALKPHPYVFIPILGTFNIATFEDLKEVEGFWWKIYESTWTGLAATTLELFKIVKKLRDEGVDPTTVDIMKRYKDETGTFISQTTVRAYLDDLCNMGFLEKVTHPQDKRRNVYYPVEEKQQNSIISIFTVISRSFSQKDLENWFRKILQNRECKITVCISEGEKYEAENGDNDAISKVAEKLYNTPFFSQYLTKQYSNSVLENNSEKTIKNENIENYCFSGEKILGEAPSGFTCEICGKPDAEIVVEKDGKKICIHKRCLKRC